MIINLSFEEILYYWNNFLWPNRKSDIKPISSIKFMGGYDMSIYNYTPYFIGYKIDNTIIGINSCFQTTSTEFRSRGIWIDEKYRGYNISQILFTEVEKLAKLNNCNVIWSIPRKSSLYAYEKFGFIKCSEFFDEGMEFGPNCYVRKDL